jgi:mannose-6-phosphate isomerase
MKNISTKSSQGLEPIGETLEILEETLPYLAKFIDTNEALSIQVHPGDEYARIHENSLGKSECWIILEAEIGAGIYLGLKNNVTKEILENALLEKKEINELLNFYPVEKGDFFFVPAGSIHAIGAGVTLAEVQQNSGITYRVWDWNRVDQLGNARELHVKKSIDVIEFAQEKNNPDYFQMKKNLLLTQGLSELCHHTDFHLFILNLNEGDVFKKVLDKNARPCSIMNFASDISINGTKVDSYGSVTLEKESELIINSSEKTSLLIIF